MAVTFAPPRYPVLRVPRSGVKPSLHLTQLAAAVADSADSASAAGPVITVCGDSTGTADANNEIAPTENLFGILKRRFMEDNPGVTFTFNDRSVGGSTWNDLKATPNFAGGITAPSWYSATGQPWIVTYVKENGAISNPAPDLVVIPMGVNDSYAIALSNIKAVLDIFGNATHFPIQPDMILVTNTGHAPNNSYEFQNGYQKASSLLRSIALVGASAAGNTTFTKRIGLIDLGRVDAMARLGFDPCAQSLMQTSEAVTGVTAFPYTFDECDGDFYMDVTFPSQGSTLFSSSNQINIYVGGAINSGASEPRILIVKNGSNFAAQYVFPSPVVDMTSGVAIGSGDVRFRVSAKQGHLIVYLNNTKVFDQLVARSSGQFSPRITMTQSVSPNMTINTYSAGKRLRTQRSISETQMWGADDGPYGGNGVNHVGSIGGAAVVQNVLESTNLDCSEVVI